jgi:hypothetical protein
VSVGAECGAHLGAGPQQHPGEALLLAGEPRRRHGNAERRDDGAGVSYRCAASVPYRSKGCPVT